MCIGDLFNTILNDKSSDWMNIAVTSDTDYNSDQIRISIWLWNIPLTSLKTGRNNTLEIIHNRHMLCRINCIFTLRKVSSKKRQKYIDGLVHNSSSSTANALELLQSCAKPLISYRVQGFTQCDLVAYMKPDNLFPGRCPDRYPTINL